MYDVLRKITNIDQEKHLCILSEIILGIIFVK